MLSQESFDKSIELVAVNTEDQLVYLHDALWERRSDAFKELEYDIGNVVGTVKRLKRQLLVLQKKRAQLEGEDLDFYVFRLNEISADDKVSVSKTLIVSKIRETRKKIEDIDTKIRWMGNRIRKIARTPNTIWRHIGDLNEEVLEAMNALRIRRYLDENNIHFGDLRSHDFNRMFYKLREDGYL